MSINCDVLVVGAGPAGCSASFFSKLYDKENNYDVLLLDRLTGDKFSKYHNMCGCCISKDGFNDIKPIKPQFILEKIMRIEEFVADELVLQTDVEGYIIDRPKFQNDLIREFERLGGGFKQEGVVDVSQKNGSIKVKTNEDTYETNFLIAADGTNSLIRKKLGFGDIQRILCQQYIIDEESEHGVLKFFYDEKYEGEYKWIFPNGASSRVGFPFKSEKIDSKYNIIEKQSRFIGFGGIKKRVDGNVMLIGDAAGQTNILSKGGIRAGMYAGKLAAKAIIIDNEPTKYESKWKNSIFNDSITMSAFQQLKTMSNKELFEHYEPFQKNLLHAYLKILFSKKYWKYKNLYKAYEVERKIGW